MAEICEKDAAIVLASCGRRCCICRRFKPLRLQVHHIDERAKGGSNDLENLIALCLTCHTDVHSNVPFTRRFTTIELKMHRDNLYKLVAEGRLPQDEKDVPFQESTDHAVEIDGAPKLMPQAVNLLIESSRRGFVMDPCGGQGFQTVFDRDGATKRAAFKQLLDLGLLEFNGGSMYVLTLDGFNAADAYLALINEKQQ